MVKLSVPILRQNQTPDPNTKFLRKPRHKIGPPALLGLYSKHFPVNYFDLPNVEDIDSITFQEDNIESNSSPSETLSDYESSGSENSDSEDN